MRDNRTVSSAFSTYAVGGAHSPVRPNASLRPMGRGGARPAVLAVAASAIVITFASGMELSEVATPSSNSPESGDAGRRPSIAEDAPARPGLFVGLHNFQSDGLQYPSVQGSGNATPVPAAKESLSSSLVAAQERRPNSPAGRNPAGNSELKQITAEAIVGGEARQFPHVTSDCAPSCSHQEKGRAFSDVVRAQLPPTHNPRAADLAGATQLPGGQTQEASLVRRSASALAADRMPESVLFADSQPATLIEPTGELIAAASVITQPAASGFELGDETKTARLESLRIDSHSPSAVQQIDPIDFVRAGGQVDTPSHQNQPGHTLEPNQTAEAPKPTDPSTATEPSRTIAHHLERISARYTQARGMEEPAIPSGVEPAGMQASLIHASVSASNGPSDVSGAPPLIIHDDELVSIELGELVSLFEDRLDRPLYVWMKESSTASKYVTVETLAAVGIGATYEPHSKQIVFSLLDD